MKGWHTREWTSPAAQLMAIEVISELLASTSPHQLGQSLAEHLRELTGTRTVMILVHSDQALGHELLNVSPLRRATLFSVSDLQYFCPDENHGELPYRPEELPADHPLREPLLRAGIRSMARYPLRAGGEMVGLLLLLDIPGVDRIDEINQIITILSPPIALSLRNALAFRQIEQQARELEQRVAERMADLQQKNAELERFTYTVSHDLKSPLITIKGFSGSLKRDLASGRHDRLEQDLERIEMAADKMTALLGDLLDLSRIGRIINAPEPVPMNALVSDVLAQLAGPLRGGNVEVVVQPGLPTVPCDRLRMAEVVQNLLENALKCMGDQPEPRILFGMRKERGEPVFFVQDNGMGIDPKHHEDIFGLFNKLDATTEGTGIGLALVKRIIEVHGGRVWVESEGAGRGSTFCFTLPAQSDDRQGTV